MFPKLGFVIKILKNFYFGKYKKKQRSNFTLEGQNKNKK